MGKIALEGMEFFAYHGFYKSEREIGNKYGVDVEITVDFSSAAESDNLKQTVNYEQLYRIIGEAMSVPAKLLEHIAEKITLAIFEHFPQVQDVKVVVRKFNPPIGGICHSARVTLFKERHSL